MGIRSKILAGTTALTLAACTATGPGTIGQREGVGIAAGALAGGVLGNQIGSGSGNVVATVAGALIGGLAGGAIGSNLDQTARQRALQAEYQALSTGQTTNWRAGNSNVYGQIQPQAVSSFNGQTCRDYTHTIFIDGAAQTARGRACLQPDGTWRPV